MNRLAVVLVAAGSLVVAYLGENAYSLLEAAYSLMLVGLFVPLMLGLYSDPRRPAAGICSMVVGTSVWLVHFVCDWEFFLQPFTTLSAYELPVSLSATTLSLIAYLVIEWPRRRAA